MFDFFSDLGDAALAPLGLTDSVSSNQAKRNLARLQGIELPELTDLDLARYESVADPRDFLTAQKASRLGQVDPATREAQMAALSQLQEIGTQGGLTDADRARLQQIARDEAIREQGQRAAVTQGAQARGMAGSGLELAGQLAAQAGAADRASQRGLGVTDLAQQRALQALISGADLAGGVRGQDYQAASAQDIINRFNAGMRSEAGLEQARNLQNIAGSNVDLENRQRFYNTQTLPQTRYQHQLDRYGMETGQLNTIAGAKDEKIKKMSDAAARAGEFVASGGLSEAARQWDNFGSFAEPASPIAHPSEREVTRRY